MVRKTWAAWAVMALVIAGCGGGGGGGGSAPGSSGTPDTPVDATTPTFRFSTGYPESRASELAVEVLDNGSRLLKYAQFVTDIAHRFAAADSPTSLTANCAYTGSIALQLTDRDGNRRVSAGDSITATLTNCGVPALSRAVTGTLRLDISATTPTADLAFQARLTLVDALQLAALGGGPNLGVVVPGTLRGSLDVQWAETESGAQLRAMSSSADDLRFTAVRDGTESTDALRGIDVSQAVRYDSASVVSSMAFLFDVGTRGGMLRVRTLVPMQGDLNALPRQMRIQAELAAGRILRADRDTLPGGSLPGISTFLVEANGSATSNRQAWGSFVSLMKDRRETQVFNITSDQGGGYVALLPWRGARLPSDIDRACQQQASAGVSNFRADALFQLPVVGAPAPAMPNAVLKIQFGRAIAESETSLQFRLVDAAEVVDPASPTWTIAATTVRRGAYYEIRPAEPLRQDRTCYLQSSYDGSNWTGDRTIRDPQGQIVNVGSESFASLHTDNQLVADTTFSDLATVAANTPARLRGRATLRDGQAVSSYQWQQLSGVPLVLSTPQAAETDAILDTSSPRAVGDAIMQLTVTDSLGNTDRVRVAMKVGNQILQGAAFYLESRDLPPRKMTVGTGSIFYGPEQGRVSPRVPGLSQGGTGTSFSVTPSNGNRLAVGTYANATATAAPGVLPGLLSGVFCNTIGSPVSGSLEVLDVGYATDGSITRLAIDFVQRCDASSNEFRRGSYRYNSSVVLRP